MRRSGMLRDRLKRFAQARRGAVAVEFAFLALPFLFMLFAVLELALVFLLSASLDTAMEDASRQIRTGNFQRDNGTTGAASQNAFKGLVCRKMMWLATGCDTALQIDVRRWEHTSATKWSEANNLGDPYVPETDTSTGKTTLRYTTLFNTGGPKDIVLVRGYFHWVLLTPFLSQALQSAEGGVTVVQSTQTFRNEPY